VQLLSQWPQFPMTQFPEKVEKAEKHLPTTNVAVHQQPDTKLSAIEEKP